MYSHPRTLEHIASMCFFKTYSYLCVYERDVCRSEHNFQASFSNFIMWVLNTEHRSHFFSCTMLAKLSLISLCVSVFFLPVLCSLSSGGCSKILPWWLKTVLSTLEAGHLKMKIMMSSNLYHFWCSKAGSVSCLFQLLTAADTLILIASFQSVFQWSYHLPFCRWHKPI